MQDIYMSEKEFTMRLTGAYEGDTNTISRLEVDQKIDGAWQPLDLGTSSPGFDIFVYSIFTCQHMYFRVNCAERGLVLDSAEGSILIGTRSDWEIDTLQVKFSGLLSRGKASQEDIDYLVSRMKQCPVSRNLSEIRDAVTTVTLR
jgi:hypothetical protein